LFRSAAAAVAASLSCLPAVAVAHHGLDFILVRTAHLPEQGTAYALTRVNYLDEETSETEIEPAVLYGLSGWMAVELHAHFANEGGSSFDYESIAPAMHIRLTPRGDAFSFGLSAEYAFADEPDAPDVGEVAAIAGIERNGWMASANVILEKASGASGEWGYAAGLRRTYAGKHGVGLEVLGSFEGDGYGEALIGYYGELSQRFTVNAGVGTGFDAGPDGTAHMTFIWRFR